MGEEGSWAVLVLLALLKVDFGRYVPSKSASTAPCQSSLHLTIASFQIAIKKDAHSVAVIVSTCFTFNVSLQVACYSLMTGDFLSKAEVSNNRSVAILIRLDQAVLREHQKE